MSAGNKVFIFTESQTNTVLFIKRSLKFNYFTEIEGVRIHVISSSGDLPPMKYTKHTYDPRSGFRKDTKKITKRMTTRREVLKRKIEISLIILASIQIMISDQRHDFGDEGLRRTQLSDEVFKEYWLIMSEERKLLNRKMKIFLKNYFKALNEMSSLWQVNEFFDYLHFNMNLGTRYLRDDPPPDLTT